MISVFSVMNDEKIAKEYLLRGLSRQTTKYELFMIDNRASKYMTASQANNVMSDKASGDYLMFMHQDVLLPSRDWLKIAENWLSTQSRIGVAGVAGMIKPKLVDQREACLRYYLLQKLGKLSLWFQRYGRGNVLHGVEAVPWGGRFISDIASVQTVDEAVLIIPTDVFDSTRFDETTCSDWDLYGVDFALTASQKGYKAYVLPCSVFHRSIGRHKSTGGFCDAYIRTLAGIIEKHKREKVINTTSGLCPTKKELMELFWKPGSKRTHDVIRALT